MNVHPVIKENALAISKAGLAFTFGIAASAIMLVSVDAYIKRNPAPAPETACAIEYSTTDGNLYRPSVADTCKEAWAGFDWNSLPDNWREVMATRIVRN